MAVYQRQPSVYLHVSRQSAGVLTDAAPMRFPVPGKVKHETTLCSVKSLVE